MEILQKLRESASSVPAVMLTGHGDERLAVDLMRAGASDYVPKDEISAEALAQNLIGVMRLHQVEMDKRRAEQELFKSNDKISDILESISDAFFAIDYGGRFTYVNQPARCCWSAGAMRSSATAFGTGFSPQLCGFAIN